MKLQIILPHPLLQEYILAYTYAVLETDSYTSINFFPNKISSLSLILTQNPYVKSLEDGREYNNILNFTGQHIKSVLYECGSIEIINVVFKPWGAFSLLGVPQHELVNQNTNALDAFPEFKNVINQLQDYHQCPEKCIRILEDILLKKFAEIRSKDKKIMHACQMIDQNLGTLSIKELCKKIGMSKTSIEDHFNNQIGYSPKTYSRITRFNECFNEIKQQQNRDWQELVLRYNYYDQNHFIKEFKEFYGATPTKLLDIKYDISDFINL